MAASARLRRIARHPRTEGLQPEGQPRALEAGVTGEQNTSITPEVGLDGGRGSLIAGVIELCPCPPGSLAGAPQLARGRCGRAACPSPARTPRGGSTRAGPPVCQRAHRLLLPYGVIAVDVAVNPGATARKSHRSPSRPLRAASPRTPAPAPPSTSSAPNRPGDCTAVTVALRPLLAVEGDQSGDVDVRNPVAVGEAEVLVPHVLKDPLQAAPRSSSPRRCPPASRATARSRSDEPPYRRWPGRRSTSHVCR